MTQVSYYFAEECRSSDGLFVLASEYASLEQECERFRALLKEIRPTIPRDVLELWCADRDAALSDKP